MDLCRSRIDAHASYRYYDVKKTMASEAERAAILAEYKASVAAANNDDEDDFDDEDEADFDPDDDDDEEGEDDDEEEEEASEEPDYVVLTGSIHLNEEGRIIYAGTWCMKSELDSADNQQQHKKHPKFKLKSQEVYAPPTCDEIIRSGKKNIFDVRLPTLTKNKESESITRRMVIFDGFFFDKPPPATEEGSTPNEKNGEKTSNGSSSPKKIKERDVELFVSVLDSDEVDKEGDTTYRIAGRGQNEYGQFVVDGRYTPPTILDKHSKATVICHKTYGVGGDAKETRAAKKGSKRKARPSDDDSFDDDFDGEERADYTELIELSEDANLSVEELRKKYYGGDEDEEDDEDNEDDDGGGKMSAAKKPRLDEESDDEECGF